MKKKKEEEQSAGAPEWMVTFSDAMTLLMVFFILLFSMSTVDQKKESQLASAFNNIFSGGGDNPILGEGVGDNINFNEGDPETTTTQEASDNLLNTLRELVSQKGLEEYISIEKNFRGVSVIFVDSLLFESGKADLKNESREILLDISGVLNEIGNQIIVEGHTDDLPINTYMFSSNWELSTSRAVVVTRFLIDGGNVNPTRISAQGYGEFRPVVTNDSPENRARNRRVNILILNEDIR